MGRSYKVQTVGWVETVLSSKPSIADRGLMLGFASLNPTYRVQLLRKIFNDWLPAK